MLNLMLLLIVVYQNVTMLIDNNVKPEELSVAELVFTVTTTVALLLIIVLSILSKIMRN